MPPDASEFFSRGEVLGGLPARRASTLLFAIESRTARLVDRSRRAAARFITEKTEQERERAFLEALAEGRDLPLKPTIQDLERYAPEWAPLVPPDVNLRAALTHLIGEKYYFTYSDVPSLRRALGLEEEAVRQAYQRRYQQPLEAIFAPQITRAERLRWTWDKFAGRLEKLPPFWLTIAFVTPLDVLALPIALAEVGPVLGCVLMIAFGLITLLTAVALSEAVVRSGPFRYGGAFMGRMAAEYLGRPAALIFSAGMMAVFFVSLVASSVGFATTLASTVGLPVVVWIGLLFGVGLYFLRRQTFAATIASTVLVQALLAALIVILVLFTLAHVRPAHLRYINAAFLGSESFNPATFRLIYGTVTVAYSAHLWIGSCATIVLRRDPGGRSLIRGAMASVVLTCALGCLWIVAVNGAIPPAALARETGTALRPLAQVIGPAARVAGTVFITFSVGLASIHYSLGLFYLARDQLPEKKAGIFARRGQALLASSPAIAAFLLSLWLVTTGTGSFAGLMSLVGVIATSLFVGVFPVLLLAASRRKGELVPGTVFHFLRNPALLGGLYGLFIAALFLHGLVIWQDLLQRAAALFVGGVMIVATFAFIRRGAFTPRAVVELRVEHRADARAVFSLVADGKPLNAAAHFEYDGREADESVMASGGEIRSFAALRSASFDLPAGSWRELKVWAHRLTTEGNSQGLAARLELQDGAQTHQVDLSDSNGQVVLPLADEGCEVKLTFAARSLMEK